MLYNIDGTNPEEKTIYQSRYLYIVDAVNDLQSRGFTLDFSIIGNQFLCSQQKFFLKPDEVNILEIYRFRGNRKNEDMIICGLEAGIYGFKGILILRDKPYAKAVPASIN